MAGVTIVEVGPRDGLQNEKRIVATEEKLELISFLLAAGLTRLEVTAFVSPKWVPQMADHEAVLRGTSPAEGLVRSVLVPNERGTHAALEIGVEELAIFTSASESFARKNINCSIDESIKRFQPVADLARNSGVRLRGYVSCAVECPYEGAVAPHAVADIANTLADLGCTEVSLADTIGRASPDSVYKMLSAVGRELQPQQLACHFHDTYGRALENIDVALEHGIRVFDSAIGGLGGCPYAPGAAGNLSTLLLVNHLEHKGYSTDLDIAALERAEELATKIRAISMCVSD
ncbi:hydroxymethylglutaryl-CoA lyase [Ochrobactrum sp. RH1CCR137]|uniref:hydroxymethylglutaryl-CoA lyase n=1 Tax=Brucella intermedia TaxID=94625 RepID=UPI0015F8A4E7|nr:MULTISPECIES: hydroxymethylglutaryl-CoA lyase [Brucella/Ochrobactrum group]MBA8845870.1 hydroxymethylglutaryl-CoA lyase [Ochrobactrum sp. RH1CCR137]MBA8857592.1 hydroxymethylglutaryl-CoA lyase [Ochrobactrum sp. RH1CCR134]UXO86200.1 hydroxymethylglutaryl-CoA lyase [Brucella intermedia]